MDTKTLIGIDYGQVKIGIALGRNNLVMPLTEVSGVNEMSAIHEITRIILENKASTIIMGLPISADGKDTHQARKVRRFSKLLKVISKKPVIFANEYRSTQDAVAEARATNSTKKSKNEDALAAALILKRYYNEANT